MADFPNSVKTWSDKTNNVDIVDASDVNNAYDEIIAIEDHLINTRKFPPTGANYSEFEDDGTLVFNGDATVWDDMLPVSVTVGSGGSAPAFSVYNGNLRAYEFNGSGGASHELNLGWQMSHRRKEETNIVPHIHLFIPDDVTGGTIKFYCEYTWTNVNQTGAVATTTISGTVVRGASAGISNNHILSFGTVTGTGKTLSSIFMCRIYRDPADVADTFGSSVWLKSADLHVEIDTVGSREPLAK
jgi:hypothetical protein